MLSSSRLALTAAQLLLTFASLSAAVAQHAEPRSPLFLWEYYGVRGVVKSVQWTWGQTEFSPTGLSYSVVSVNGWSQSVTWDPSERRLVRLGSTVATTRYFDDEGYLLRQQSREGTWDYSVTYSRNAHGHRVGTSRLADGTVESVTTYNDLGQRIEFVVRAEIGWIRHTYEYNEVGDVTLHSTYKNDSGDLRNATLYTYVYDEHGNWVEQTTYTWVPVLDRFETTGTTESRSLEYY